MRTFTNTCLLAILLLNAQPVQAASWVDDVMGWFSSLFTTTEHVAANPTQAEIDSLRATPLGIALNEVPDRDTAAIAQNWPYASVDPAADLDRYNRIARQSVLLTDPTGKLPLHSDSLRVIYREGYRPGYFLDMSSRFAGVQEVAFSDLVSEVLRISDPLPTVIIVDAASGGTDPFWYLSLTDSSLAATTLIHFGGLSQLAALPEAWSVINAPLRSKESEAYLAQAVFGAELLDGRNNQPTPAYAAGVGYRLAGTRPGFRLPEQLGIDRLALDKVDYQINRGIRYRAMPGAQLLVMKNGQVVYQKAYGHHTYRRQPVNNADLYDLASVTKAAATSLAVMKLYDEGRLNLSKRVRDYLPGYKRSIAGRYRIEQLLTHQTGLQPNMPVGQFMSREHVASEQSMANNLPIGPSRWLDSRLPNWVRQAVGGKLEFSKRPTFLYSDVNYYLLQQVVEEISQTPLDEFVAQNFYRPMGLGRLAYNPHARFPATRMVPTIKEPWMRGGLLRGFVHDEGAAMIGGVSGHAGLFGNAHDLGQLFQLLNNGGQYNGDEYLSAETVRLFTAHNRFNYRALGFDRLAGRLSDAHSCGAGTNTVGHLGYTGTSVWADPENDLVYVLLTNRVNPDPKNEKFIKMNIRSKVSRSVYGALNTWKVES